jgi:hypothetical protein
VYIVVTCSLKFACEAERPSLARLCALSSCSRLRLVPCVLPTMTFPRSLPSTRRLTPPLRSRRNNIRLSDKQRNSARPLSPTNCTKMSIAFGDRDCWELFERQDQSVETSHLIEPFITVPNACIDPQLTLLNHGVAARNLTSSGCSIDTYNDIASKDSPITGSG